ncbi:hypothetical protein DHEL01_v200976 [Diaporthe helianthi]|uniref:Uncharacterized protein n=1 Tax=Diaporthe helianthi TaxID=158607 RepID=A0A2P5IDP5_DIAHE|nr:hypothetical protein DHEL01_v200976 [Diaporthe helianthi]
MSQKGLLITGIVLAVVFFLLLVGSLVACCLQRRRAHKHRQVDEEHALQRVIVPITEPAPVRRTTIEQKVDRRQFGN